MKTLLRQFLQGVTCRRAVAVCALALMSASAPTASAQSAASAYRYAMPAGWTQSMEADIEALTPADPQAQAQIMLLAPKPLAADFDGQFASERAALESFWGLRAPQAAPPQRGHSSKGPYAAHFASFDSDGGERYMSFLALGSAGSFAMMVFVAASAEAFNRLAPVATQTFRTIEVIRR
jgi:hypothetical protein